MEAIKILEFNINLFPEYINSYDSLADAYLASKEKEKAVELGVSDIKLNKILKDAD